MPPQFSPVFVGPMPAPVSHLHHVRHLAHRHHHKLMIFASGVALYLTTLSTGLQLAYPDDRTLPGTRLAGSFVSVQSSQEVTAALQTLDERRFILKLGSSEFTQTPHEAGLSFVSSSNVRAVIDYPIEQRFIPFSALLGQRSSADDRLRPKVDMPKLRQFAHDLVVKSTLEPTEGVLRVVNGTVAEQASRPGTTYSAAAIIQVLSHMSGEIPAVIAVAPEVKAPIYSSKTLRSAALRAGNLIRPLTILIGGDSHTVSTTEVGNWIRFESDPKSQSINPIVDQARVATYLTTLSGRYYEGPANTIITLLDGQENSRQIGTSGKYLDTSAAAASIATTLKARGDSVTLSLSSLAPSVQYVRHYSNTQAGLQALLDDLVKSKGEYGISVHELSGRGWVASSGGNRQFVTASTYKLFVAYSTLKRIENGTFSWNDNTNGTTLSTCMSRMIINSDNACAIALGQRIGWATVIGEVNSLGLNHTTRDTTFHSTSNDEALFLTKLETGDILSDLSHSFLIGLMEQQHYRSGIPKGTGALVADKVGFLDDLLHDAAIVYGDHSTYVLVIMTDDSSWSEIADTAKQIHTQMSR